MLGRIGDCVPMRGPPVLNWICGPVGCGVGGVVPGIVSVCVLMSGDACAELCALGPICGMARPALGVACVLIVSGPD